MNESEFEKVAQNPSIVWAQIFVNELARCGLKDVCIAPGSRNTPLTLAFYNHPGIRIHTHLDERSAGFFGLGLALATDRPVALLCTSGSAGANFFPAIIEANMSQVPLLVLTADRPPELRHSGANQTIDQVKMFGDHVLWSVDAALPEQEPPEIAVRNLRSMAARLLATADGFRKGPVHLNFPFRKPLEPKNVTEWHNLESVKTDRERPNRLPFTRIERGVIQPSASQVDFLASLISQIQRGMIVCGPRCPGGDFPAAVSNMAQQFGYPIFADPLSGLRFGSHLSHAPVIGSYETFLHPSISNPRPELVLYFGAVPTAKRLNEYLAACDSAVHIHVRENGIWADENHVTSHFYQLSPRELCLALGKTLTLSRDSNWLSSWIDLEEACWKEITRILGQMDFDGAYVFELLNLLGDGHTLLAGNSLPVRHVVQFGKPGNKQLHVFANRGASGIDGNISTGLGIAASHKQPTTILTGDITFYHDSNGLLGLQNLDSKDVTFIILNNEGGGIFQRLPVAQFDPPFHDLFQMSHGLDFSSIAKTYAIDYIKVANLEEFKKQYLNYPSNGQARLIEIRTDPVKDNQQREYLESLVRQNLKL